MDEYEALQRQVRIAVDRLRESGGDQFDECLKAVIDCKRRAAEYVRSHSS